MKISNLFLFVLFLTPALNVKSSRSSPLVVTWNELQTYLMYAYSAYCTEGLQNWTCFWCTKVPSVPPLNLDQVLYDEDTDTYGYIAHSNNSIIIGFRGTNDFSLKNWVTDFEFWRRTPYHDVPGAEVHYGWYTVYEKLKPVLLPVIRALEAKYPKYHIYTTGHSLGAALSILCAVDLAREGIQNVEVYNFGDTRVGNHAFAKYFKTMVPLTRRTTNQNDLVVHYPAEWLGYHHVATEVWFPNNVYNFTICDGSGEDSNCSDSVLGDSIFDHLGYLGFDQSEGHSYNCGN